MWLCVAGFSGVGSGEVMIYLLDIIKVRLCSVASGWVQ